jgi:hypothetical protein
MRRIVGLALLALLALAPTAYAAPPKRVAGVRLTWPSKTVFKPGETVALKVRSDKRKARVALIAGKRVLARRTLRNGTFRATVPKGAGGYYKLRVTIAGKHYRSVITTPACAGTNAALSTDGQLGRPGTPLKLTITNRGPGCLMAPTSPLATAWVGPDGRGVDLSVDYDVRLPGDMRIAALTLPVELAPGESHTIATHVPNGLADGTYTVRWGTASTTFTVNQCLGPATPTTTALQLGYTTVPAGGKLPYALVNTGTGCLATGVGYRLERQEADGSFTHVNANELFITIGLMLGPGGRYPGTASIPADAVPGTYRLTHESSATFTVTAPG